MKTGADRVLLLVERDGDDIANASRCLLAFAREQADRLAAEFAVLLVGHGLDSLAQAVASVGPDAVYTADDPSLDDYSPERYAGVLHRAIEHLSPRLVLLGDTFAAREVGPAVAFRLGMPFLGNCVTLETSEAEITSVQPRYSGAVYVKARTQLPAIVCLQPGQETVCRPVQAPARIVPVPVVPASRRRVQVVGTTKGEAGEVDMARAEVIVAGGRGLGGPQNVGLMRELARALGGAVGCSRPLCDLGWLPAEHLVGMSGSMVSPSVYIACGISGAPQHVAGMRDSRLIIAINKDESAPIFGVAHYGVVGDLFQIVPAVIEEARKSPASEE